MFEKITEAEINERSMAKVSTTPGRRTAFGEGGMDAEALKLRFDRLGRFIAGRLNEVFEGLPNGELAKHLYIAAPEGSFTRLDLFVTNLLKGDLAEIYAKTPSGEGSLDMVCDIVFRIDNGLATGDFASNIYVAKDLTLTGFYEAFLNLKEIAKGDPGEKGDPYTLTEEDKAIIVEAVIAALPVYEGEVETV